MVGGQQSFIESSSNRSINTGTASASGSVLLIASSSTSSMRALCCEERGCIREFACRRSLHENGGMKAKAGTPSRNMRECTIDITSAFRGVHAAHKQVDVVVTTARFWRNSGFILGGMRARRGDSSLGANQARKHSVGHTRMFVSRFVVVSPVAVVLSESPLELAGLFQYHIAPNRRPAHSCPSRLKIRIMR